MCGYTNNSKENWQWKRRYTEYCVFDTVTKVLEIHCDTEAQKVAVKKVQQQIKKILLEAG